jgi:hypothetical protein
MLTSPVKRRAFQSEVGPLLWYLLVVEKNNGHLHDMQMMHIFIYGMYVTMYVYIYIIYILSCERLQCMYYMAAQFLSAQHIAIVLKTVRYTHDISWYIQFTLCSKNVAKHWTLNDPLQRLHMVWNPHLDMGKSLGHPSTLWNLKTAETAGIKTVSVTAN